MPGVGIVAIIGLSLGLAIGMLPLVRSGLSGFVSVVSMIPPLAVLPILFLAARTLELPREQIVKAQTLGASSLAITLRVALPQIMPRLLGALRLALGPAWLFLITAEAFKLGDRVVVFDTPRWDPHAPDAFGATITYDPDTRKAGIPPRTLEEIPNAPDFARHSA